MEDLARVELAVAVGVLEDQDAVADGVLPGSARAFVRVALGDPEPPALVEGHRDRLRHVGLGGEERGLEAVGNAEQFERLLRTKGDVLRVLGVLRSLGVARGILEGAEDQGERQQIFHASIIALKPAAVAKV